MLSGLVDCYMDIDHSDGQEIPTKRVRISIPEQFPIQYHIHVLLRFARTPSPGCTVQLCLEYPSNDRLILGEWRGVADREVRLNCSWDIESPASPANRRSYTEVRIDQYRLLLLVDGQVAYSLDLYILTDKYHREGTIPVDQDDEDERYAEFLAGQQEICQKVLREDIITADNGHLLGLMEAPPFELPPETAVYAFWTEQTRMTGGNDYFFNVKAFDRSGKAEVTVLPLDDLPFGAIPEWWRELTYCSWIAEVLPLGSREEETPEYALAFDSRSNTCFILRKGFLDTVGDGLLAHIDAITG